MFVHSDAVVSIVASQQEGPGLESQSPGSSSLMEVSSHHQKRVLSTKVILPSGASVLYDMTG